MKFLDKIKDLFTDEINDTNEELIEKNEDNKLPKVMREETNVEKKQEKDTFLDNDIFKDFENLELDFKNENNSFRFPIAFEENELPKEDISKTENTMFREKEKNNNKFNELYSKKEMKEDKVTLFKVSPVISPVYGILDKNYKKDEVLSKPKSSSDISRNNQKIDFESVRKKAYGSLVDDIKDNLSNIQEKKHENELSFYELKENVDEITLGEIEKNYSDFGLTIEDYGKKSEKIMDNNIIPISVDEKNIENIDINLPIIDSSKNEDDFDDGKNSDIFNLIDNMYQEREENND